MRKLKCWLVFTLLLWATVALAIDPSTPLRIARVFTNTAPATTPNSCAFGKSPNVLAMDTYMEYECVASGGGDYYTAIPLGSGAPNYSQAVSGTSVTLTHGLGTKNILVACYDSSDVFVEPNTIDIAAVDPWDVTVTFAMSQTGRCVVNGTGTTAKRYGEDFTATSVTLAGSEHGLATKDLSVSCYDNSSPARRVEPDAVTINSSTFDVVVTFASSLTGRCEVQ